MVTIATGNGAGNVPTGCQLRGLTNFSPCELINVLGNEV